jgi:N-acetylglucosamine-6-sulfatase
MSLSMKHLLTGILPFLGVSHALRHDQQTPNQQPNFIFVLTDDQDLHMNSVDYMPLLQQHLIDKGTFYKRHFVTTAVCCPARVSLLTGKAAHNTNVTDVFPPYGRFS